MKRLLLILAMSALPVGMARAGGNEPASMPGMAMSMQMSMEIHTRMGPMMNDLRRLSGAAFDRAFFSMMIPHHQSAIDMSRMALPRLKDPLVRAWAQSIIDDQHKEIAGMQGELHRLGGVDTARQTHMHQAMARMGGMMAGMGSMMEGAQNPDRMFLEMMVLHHGSANEMANLALQRGQREAVLSTAQRIMTAQADEMHDFKDWLRSRP